MGWTCIRYEDRPLDITEFLTAELTDENWKVLDVSRSGNVYHFLQETNGNPNSGKFVIDPDTGKIRIIVQVLVTCRKSDGFCWKIIDETMDPTLANCAKRLIYKASPTNDPYAQTWRQRCLDR